MKLTAAFFLIASLQVSATAFSQKVTLSAKALPLDKVFTLIAQQTGYEFIYDAQTLAHSTPVTLDLHDAALEDALLTCLDGQGLGFFIKYNTIVIRPANPDPVPFPSAQLPPGDIHGHITNAQGEPLSGANIIVKRLQRGTQTDAKGEFMLKNVYPDDILLVSFIGYKTQSIKVGGGKEFPVALQETDKDLDKVVIQAYGTTTQRLQTGDISTVSAAELEKQPGLNPILSLQGEVPGLNITATSGYASGPVLVELRGRNSLNGSFPSDPLYIVDGVPLTVNEVGGTSSYGSGSSGFLQNGFTGAAGGQSPLFSLNPADIESISVLKDADATAIYGSRGANGVILVTTKRGKAGKPKLEISAEQGDTKVTRFWQMLNTSQYLAVRREAFKNDGITMTSSNAYDVLDWDTTRYTNWQHFIDGGVGKYTNLEGALSGGDAHTVYRIGMGYSRQTNINTVSGGDQRGNVSFSLTTKTPNDRLSATLIGNYTLSLSNLIGMPGNPELAPDAPAVYDSLGNLNFAGWAPIDTRYPFGNLKIPYSATTYFLNSNLVLNYAVLRGLNVKVSLGYNNSVVTQKQLEPIASQDPDQDPVGSAEFGTNINKNWIVEPQVTYDATIWKGKLSALAGASLQDNSTDGQLSSGTGYTSDFLIGTISNAPTIYGFDDFGEYKYGSVLGRVNYNWEDKYIINLSGRRDGSSRFGPEHEYGNFGAVGIAWIFTEEPWLQKHLSFLSFGKLRGSYGSTGSDNVGQYQYITRWSSSGLFPYGGIQPLVPTQHADPNFQWEVDKKLEGALELGFLKDRVTLVSAYYRNRCGDQLIYFPTPGFTGFSTVTANLPALVQNVGWEFTLGGKIINSKNVVWSVRGNVAFNGNKLLAYPGLANSPYANTYIVGKPLNLVYLLHYTGVDPLTGQYMFFDKNHDGMISNNPGPTDDRYAHNLNAKYFGGFGSDLSYKHFQFSVFFTYKNQIGQNIVSQGEDPGLPYNQPTLILGKEWTYPGQVASVARFTTRPQQSDGYFHASDAGYTNASYVRLRNLVISYSIPNDYARKIGLQSGSIFIRGQNLFVITPYKGIDPEIQNFGGLPPAKIFTAGISVNL